MEPNELIQEWYSFKSSSLVRQKQRQIKKRRSEIFLKRDRVPEPSFRAFVVVVVHGQGSQVEVYSLVIRILVKARIVRICTKYIQMHKTEFFHLTWTYI